MDLIRVENLSKRYSDTVAVDHLSFSLEKGETLALLGPSGCGKTTTLRLIAGFEVPDEGIVEIGGEAMAENGRSFVPPERRGVGMVFQEYALFPHLTVGGNVAFGLKRWSAKEREARVEEILELVGLLGLQDRYPHELSGGQQQRVALARALAPSPQLLLLDEPFSNLDPDLRTQMRRDVKEIFRRTGSTAIFVTHDQEEAFEIANRVGVLNQGRLEQLDVPEEVYHRPLTRFVAEFVGSADFLPGLVTAEGIITELGTFENQQNLPTGLQVEVMIRPDDIDLVPDPDGKAVVVDHKFRGSENLYRVRLPSGRLIHSSQSSHTVFALGAKAAIKTNLVHVVAFAALFPPP